MSSDPPRAVWFALLAPPLAWFAALNAAYFTVDRACASAAGLITLHIAILVPLGVAMVAGLTGGRSWRGAGGEWPGERADPGTRTRFLSVLATLGGILFSVAILWFWVAVAILDPCDPGPRSPFAPSAVEGSPVGRPIADGAGGPVKEWQGIPRVRPSIVAGAVGRRAPSPRCRSRG